MYGHFKQTIILINELGLFNDLNDLDDVDL